MLLAIVFQEIDNIPNGLSELRRLGSLHCFRV